MNNKFVDDYLSQASPDDLRNIVREIFSELQAVKNLLLNVNQLHEITPDAGQLSSQDLTADAVHANADKVDINWWLPLTLADDDITNIECCLLKTLSSVQYLYVGGLFNRIGGVYSPNIIRYNFSTRQWEALGGGVNGRVYTIAFDPSDVLHIGGSFTDAGGDAAADYIAKLITGNWIHVGNGITGSNIRKILFDGSGNLYIAGGFTNAGGDAAADNIAQLVAGAWTNVGGGLSADVLDILFDASGTLYAIGIFLNAGGDAAADYVAKLVGGAWTHEGSFAFPSVPYRLALSPAGVLYVGLQNLPGIYQLSNGDWQEVGDFSNVFAAGAVLAIAFDSDGTLHIGGTFYDNAFTMNKVAKLVNGAWAPATNSDSSDITGNINGLAFDSQDNLLAVGTLSTIGSIKCKGAAVLAKNLSTGIDTIAALFEQYSARASYAAGSWTPTLSNVTNVAASTAFPCNFVRLLNVVLAFGVLNVDPTTAGSAIEVGMSLPVASDLSAVGDLGGVAFAALVQSQGYAIVADTANNRAAFKGVPPSAANASMYFIFSYIVK